MGPNRNFLWRLGVVLSGYAVAWTFGLFILGPLVLFFLITGRWRVRGYWNLVGAVLRGRLIITPNHPSLFYETFGIPMLLFPWYLVVPRCFIWSMPDRRLLEQWKMPQPVRTVLRCIAVDRTNRMANGRGRKLAEKVLKSGFSMVAHPEAGRTFGEANRSKTPLLNGGRVMQKITSNLAEVAYEAGAQILPAWVHVPDAEPVSISESFSRMFGKRNAGHRPVIISFGKPYRQGAPFDLTSANKRLQEEIFRA